MQLAKNKDRQRGEETIATMKKIAKARHLTKEDDFQFHFEIVQFSENPLLEEKYKSMRTKIQIFWDSLIIQENRPKEVFEEHWNIIHSIEAGKERDAFLAVQEHMKKSLAAFTPEE